LGGSEKILQKTRRGKRRELKERGARTKKRIKRGIAKNVCERRGGGL